MKIKERIENNPYRVLGVYAGGSSAREASNLSRIKAFSNVGQTAVFDFPIDEWLSPAERSAETAAQAAQLLSLTADRVENALLWISDGETDWGQKLNEAVYALLQGDWIEAMRNYGMLLTDNQLLIPFLEATSFGLFNSNSNTDHLVDFIVSLTDESDYVDILENFSGISQEDASNPVLLKIFENKIVPFLNSLFEEENDYSKNPYDNLEKLKTTTNNFLSYLEMVGTIFGTHSLKYVILLELLVNRIYNEGISILHLCANFAWSTNEKAVKGKIRVKWIPQKFLPLMNAYMHFMKEIKEYVETTIDRLQLSPDSISMTKIPKDNFEEKYHSYCVPDPKKYMWANIRYGLRQFGWIALWLFGLLNLFFFILH